VKQNETSANEHIFRPFKRINITEREREKVNDRIVERKNSLFNLYEEAICMFAVNKTSISFQTSLGIFI
jgi:hypothetical protein